MSVGGLPDPLELGANVLAIVIFTVALWFVYARWDRVLTVMGFDDRMHCTALDCVWFGIFNCCGTCDGHWTRCLTRNICCPKFFRDKNLVRMIGQFLGITSSTVELSSIIVGDLPYDGRGDFYVSFEAQANPPIITSVAEESFGKVVHFPETITIRVCKSILESDVHIKVWQFDKVIGQELLAGCSISALKLLDWADDPWDEETGKTKRLCMHDMAPGPDGVTPPWISMDIDEPNDWRILHDHETQGFVRTMRTLDQETDDGYYEEVNIAEYKHRLPLLEPNGQSTQEPSEKEVVHLECMQHAMGYVRRGGVLVYFVCLLTWCTVRFYTWSCFRQYKAIAMAGIDINEGAPMLNQIAAELQNDWQSERPWPMPYFMMKKMGEQCTIETKGTGVEPSADNQCRPSDEVVLEYCIWPTEGIQKELWECPADKMCQPRPVVGKALLHEQFNINSADLGLEKVLACGPGVCELRMVIMKLDAYVPLMVVLPCILQLIVQVAFTKYVRSRKRRNQEATAQVLRSIVQTEQRI